MELLRIVFLVALPLYTFLLFIGFVLCMYSSFRPYWSKLFFSYSHKDTEIAEQIIGRLQKYNFRIYIDFGVVLPEQELERELNNLIKNRDICIVLASSNSVTSKWVLYEVKRALRYEKRKFWDAYRDLVILAIDDEGMKLADTINEASRLRFREQWNAEIGLFNKLAKQTPEQQEKFYAAARKARKILDAFPFLRRQWLDDITVVDLRRGPLGTSLAPLEVYLKNNTTFGLQSNSRINQTVKIVTLGVGFMWLFLAGLLGLFWLVLVLKSI